jgi:hypothetical protein
MDGGLSQMQRDLGIAVYKVLSGNLDAMGYAILLGMRLRLMPKAEKRDASRRHRPFYLHECIR